MSTPDPPDQVPSEPDAVKSKLQELDDYDFEHFVADVWELRGWDSEVIQQSSDAGIDVRATKSEPYQQKVLIQAKRYGSASKVTGPNIQQYASLKQQEDNVDKVIVVTTGSFTDPARERADDLNVKLIDGDTLVHLLDGLDSSELLTRYIGDGESGSTVQLTRTLSDVVEDVELTSGGKRVGVTEAWVGLVLLTGLWGVVIFAETVEKSGIVQGAYTTALVVAFFLTPYLIYRDQKYTRANTNWSKYGLVYLVASLLAYLNIILLPIYFLQRYRYARYDSSP